MSELHGDKMKALEEERRSVLRRIDELTVGGEVEMDFDQDFADRGHVASERGENHALAEALQVQLALVERALVRLDDGTYGNCETCGAVIGAERLDVLPTATRCIAHV